MAGYFLTTMVTVFALANYSESAVVIREIESLVDHNHCTTRQFQHKTFYHDGVWFAFYSDGAMFWYQTSSDSGETWQRAMLPVDRAPNGSSSFDVLKSGDKVYISHALYPLGRYDVNAPYAQNPAKRGEYRHEGRIKAGKIEGRSIRWLADVNPGFTPDYSNIVRDADGYFWVFTRASQQVVAHRSRQPQGIEEWMSEAVCIAKKGRHAVDAAALDDGKLYVASLLTTDGKLYGNLYDGQEWASESILIADELTDVAGDDRRLSLEFDPTQKRLHLIYVDEKSKLRYRHLDTPYGPEDWWPTLANPGLELAKNVFTSVLSVDTSRTPYGLVVTYGVEKHLGKDQRVRTGEIYARQFDGKQWQGEAVLVSQPDTIHNWYPNVNQDVSDGLCVMYSRSVDKEDLGQPLAVMLSVVTSLQEPLLGVTDVLVDGENCRGAHVTTRPHNRKVVYHAPSDNWFVFHGTGHWIDKLGDSGLEREMIAWRSSKDGKTFTKPLPAVVGNGHSSSADVLLVGDCIYLSHARFGYWRWKEGIPALVDGKPIWHRDRINAEKPNFYSPYEVFSFDIAGGLLSVDSEMVALPGDRHVGHAGPHYGSIARDTNGYLWTAARALTKTGADGHLATWVARTCRPDDIASWEPHTVLFESARPGTHAPQIIALDIGHVACVLFARHEQRTAVYLYDPNSQTWGEPQIVGKGYESKRACAVFDPKSRRLHIVYTDSEGDARHRALVAPYGSGAWSPSLDDQGTLVAEKAGANKGDDDLSLSVNLSMNPASLAMVHRGPDLHLHLRYYDGIKWSPEDVRIGFQAPEWSCDEASAVADFSHGLGFVYWCQLRDEKVRKERDGIGQLRFCLIRDVAALFASR